MVFRPVRLVGYLELWRFRKMGMGYGSIWRQMTWIDLDVNVLNEEMAIGT